MNINKIFFNSIVLTVSLSLSSVVLSVPGNPGSKNSNLSIEGKDDLSTQLLLLGLQFGFNRLQAVLAGLQALPLEVEGTVGPVVIALNNDDNANRNAEDVSTIEAGSDDDEDDDADEEDANTSINNNNVPVTPPRLIGSTSKTHETPRGSKIFTRTSSVGSASVQITPSSRKHNKGQQLYNLGTQRVEQHRRLQIHVDQLSNAEIIQVMLQLSVIMRDDFDCFNENLVASQNTDNIDSTQSRNKRYSGKTKNSERRSSQHAREVLSNPLSRKGANLIDRHSYLQTVLVGIPASQVRLLEGLYMALCGSCNTDNGLNSQSPSTEARQFYEQRLQEPLRAMHTALYEVGSNGEVIGDRKSVV